MPHVNKKGLVYLKFVLGFTYYCKLFGRHVVVYYSIRN